MYDAHRDIYQMKLSSKELDDTKAPKMTTIGKCQQFKSHEANTRHTHAEIIPKLDIYAENLIPLFSPDTSLFSKHSTIPHKKSCFWLPDVNRRLRSDVVIKKRELFWAIQMFRIDLAVIQSW